MINKYSIIAVIVVVIIICMMLMSHESYLEGMWVATEDFCQDSGVDSLVLVLGENKSIIPGKRQRTGYLVSPDFGTQRFTTTHYLVNRSKFNNSIEWEDKSVWPAHTTMEVDPWNGLLRVYSDDKLYGYFTKNHEASQILV